MANARAFISVPPTVILVATIVPAVTVPVNPGLFSGAFDATVEANAYPFKVVVKLATVTVEASAVVKLVVVAYPLNVVVRLVVDIYEFNILVKLEVVT
jgi:hypothetical protein